MSFTVNPVGRVIGGREEWCEDGWGDVPPVLDIKPYPREFAATGPVAQPEWVGDLMRHPY
ncbi:hypothetical protein [Rhizomonospora bruguierae]|uniref:hypothetical protein n=1 Tax=Rhizomonospora bruguierae TaxID=1581705 RepID=UPI001BD0E57C|nr:hypothetical protein [Micromonospora sp. NBRC 107566]